MSSPRSVRLCGVEFFELKIRISLRKRFLKRNHFHLLYLSGAQMGWINEIKNALKTGDTATLKYVFCALFLHKLLYKMIFNLKNTLSCPLKKIPCYTV